MPNNNENHAFADVVERSIRALRTKLLDLTRKNRLVNFKHSASSRTHVRIIDEVPEQLFAKLSQNGQLRLIPVPLPNQIPSDEQTPEFEAAVRSAKLSDEEFLSAIKALGARPRKSQLGKVERDLRNRLRLRLNMPPWTPPRNVVDQARALGLNPSYELPLDGTSLSARHTDNSVQTLLFPDDLEAKLGAIEDSARVLAQDAGVEALYCAFGFLEYFESPDSTQALYAPLVLVPIGLDRKLENGLFTYFISGRDEDVSANITLHELLRQQHGIELPAWSEGSTISSYLDDVEALCRRKDRRWSVKRWSTIGLFTFARLAMYQDLSPQAWPADRSPASHPVITTLFAGTQRPDRIEVAPDYDIDDPDIEKVTPLLVTDADASQHSAVVDVMSGRNVVIQGPPGTGKSQTITNIIAASLKAGKRILFVAEKMAALEVVKNRLDSYGLGAFCFEAHSNKARRSDVLKSLKARLEMRQAAFDRRAIAATREKVRSERDELTRYVQRMNDTAGDTGLTVHQLVWGASYKASRLNDLPRDMRAARLPQPLAITPFARHDAMRLAGALEDAVEALVPWGASFDHPWHGVTNATLSQFDVDEVVQLVGQLKDALIKVRAGTTQVRTIIPCESADTLNGVRGTVETARRVSAPPSECPDVLLQVMRAKAERDSLVAFADALDTYRETHAWLSERVSENGLQRLDQAKLQLAIPLVRSLHLEQKTLASLGHAQQQIAATNVAIEGAVQGVTVLADCLSCADHRLGTLVAVCNVARLAAEQPRTLLAMRDESVFQDDSLLVLRAGARKISSLQKLAERLATAVDVAALPPAAELRAHAATLRASSWLQRLGSRACRDALAAYKRIRRQRRAAPLDDIIATLGAAAEYQEQAQALRNDKRLISACGRHYDGLQTPLTELVALAVWGDTVRQALPPDPQTAHAIFRALVMCPLDTLDRIRTIVRAPSFHGMQSAIQAARDLEPAVTLEEFAGRTRQRAEQHARVMELCSGQGLAEHVRLSELQGIVSRLGQRAAAEKTIRDGRAASLLGSLYQAEKTSSAAIRRAAQYLRDIAKCGLPKEVMKALLNGDTSRRVSALRDAVMQLESAVDDAARIAAMSVERLGLDSRRWFGTATVDDATIPQAIERLERALQHPESLVPYLAFVRVEAEAREAGVGAVLDGFYAERTPIKDVVRVYDAVFFVSAAERLFKDDRFLSRHSGHTHDSLRRDFQRLDRELLESSRHELIADLLERPAPAGIGQGPKKSWTNRSLIEHQVSLARPNVPLRDLLSRAHEAVFALQPCVMMSPMSVAQYLAPGKHHFDVVIMDEASQMRPEDAIGSILRGSQLVVVGDPKQLPPSSFFDRLDKEEEINEDNDVESDATTPESILDLAMACFQPVRTLNWHYRSRHESLISFSNEKFYQNLLIFPSPFVDHKDYGVKLIQTNGVYGASRNPAEAEVLIDKAAQLMRDSPDVSLGIVAVNQPQRDLLAEMLDRLIASDTYAQQYHVRWAKTLERPFVKNLENVQGDERDVIFISTVYGQDKDGHFAHRFGPINTEAGYRRLNVLFTRAKRQICVFTSIKPGQIQITPQTKYGVTILRDYLHFAESGRVAPLPNRVRQPDSDFERWFIERLRLANYNVVPQLGVKNYFIDIAVENPERRGTYMLGIECDGATYHSSKSARDRDRLRQQVLEDLGWKIYRVWSTDWFRNPDGEMARLLKYLEQLRSQ